MFVVNTNFNAKVIAETVTLGSASLPQFDTGDDKTRKRYVFPTKSGYTLAACTPCVSGAWSDMYCECWCTDNAILFKNIHNSTYTWTFYAKCVWVKN